MHPTLVLQVKAIPSTMLFAKHIIPTTKATTILFSKRIMTTKTTTVIPILRTNVVVSSFSPTRVLYRPHPTTTTTTTTSPNRQISTKVNNTHTTTTPMVPTTRVSPSTSSPSSVATISSLSPTSSSSSTTSTITAAAAAATTTTTSTTATTTTIQPVLKGFRKYAHQFKSQPASHLISFAILHEITAVLPLVLVYNFLNLFEIKIPFSEEIMDKANKMAVKVANHYGWDLSGTDGAKVLLNMTMSYAIVKVLMPVRIMVSVWMTPWMAKKLVGPVLNVWKKFKK